RALLRLAGDPRGRHRRHGRRRLSHSGEAVMSRVLVVEDEETLRNAMVRGLAKLSGVEALGAGSIAEALTVVDGGAPDVVVSDLDLPDRPGLELIGELGRRGIRCPITFVSAYVRAFSAQIPRHAGVRVLEKPVPLEK